MTAEAIVPTLLRISALGIYIHALFITISLGFPWVISALLFKWWRTRDQEYYDAARTVTAVLGLNFALGAITGTLVEFGLVQAWPGSIFVIATFGFVPLTLELIAFVGEIVLLILFIVTLGRIRPLASIGLMAAYLVMAAFSGAVITTVNSWMNVPWGTESLAAKFYPFLPTYGPSVTDPQALVKLKAELVRDLISVGSSSQVLQNQPLARSIGVTLRDPYVAFYSPYNAASMLHNVNAGMIVGVSFALVGYAYKLFRTRIDKYLKIMRAFLPVLLVLLILQPTVFGDFMGKMVASNQPTKLALMENAHVTRYDPLVGFLAYGDPQRPVVGFNSFRQECDSLTGTTLGDLVSRVVPAFDAGVASSIDLGELCLSDLAKAEERMPLINAAYYSKIASGVVALAALVALVVSVFKLGILSKTAKHIFARLGRGRTILLLSILVLASSASAASLGWFVRDGGRKPWTVYGLLYPEELVTPVPVDPIVLALFTLTFVAMAVIGLYGMYIVATRWLKFIELLKKGAGVE